MNPRPDAPSIEAPLLSIANLSVQFDGDPPVHAVRDVSYQVRSREMVAVIGESGSGKSVSSMSLLGLLGPGAEVRGSVSFEGVELLGRSERELNTVRGQKVGYVFQDASTALNRSKRVGHQIGELLRVHQGLSKSAAFDAAVEVLGRVGIPDPGKRARQYPHQFSGGMRQRAAIAMGIVLKPRLLIADEATTALDVTVQAQILELLRELRDVEQMAIIFITHDLRLAATNADNVVVMYGGRVVEEGPATHVLQSPRHPYTAGLLKGRVPGSPISNTTPDVGCRFRDRCVIATKVCATETPLVSTGTHGAACHHPMEDPHA
jgi:oligopeptide/dipeptide ABC transporter ATP-binding protein